MAAPTKVRTSLWNSFTLTGGAGNQNSAWIDLTTTFESQVNVKLTNLGTALSVAAQVQILVANNYLGGNPSLVINFGGALVGTLGGTDVNYFSVTIPIGCEAIQLVAGSNTGGNVNVDADISRVTVIS